MDQPDDDAQLDHGLDEYLDHQPPTTEINDNDIQYENTEYNGSNEQFNNIDNNDIDDVTPLSKWQHEHDLHIQQQITAERDNKQKLIQQAKADIEKFLADKEKELVKIKKQNRVDEQEYLSENKSLMEHGSVWEKVNKLVNLQPKIGEKNQQQERMRKLLLSLKTPQKTQKTSVK